MTTKYKKYRIIIINEKKLWTKNTFIGKSKKVVAGKCCRHLYYESNIVMWRILLKVLYLNGEFLLIKLKLSSERTDE